VAAGTERDLSSLEAAFDLLPTPALLVEPGSARVVFANRAAHRLAGGEFPMDRPADDYQASYLTYAEDGGRVPPHQQPGVRVARGERFANLPIDWHTPGNGLRVLIVTGDTITAPDGEPIGVITFEDVTDLRSAERSERRVRRELEAILDHVADAVTAQGNRGELIYANQAAVDLFGYETAEDLRAAPLYEVRDRFSFADESGQAVAPEDLPGRRALLGEEPDPLVLRIRPVTGGPERWSRIKARALRDEKGAVVMAINVIEDVTELKRAAQEARFLADAGRVLASSLDYERTLQTVAGLAVPQVADWCVVDLATPEGYERMAIAHADPAKLRWTEEMSRRYPPRMDSTNGVVQVLRTGQPEHYPDIPDEILVAGAQDAEHLELIRSVGMVSAMIVPMTARGVTVGAITMVSAESGRHFDEGDFALAQELGRRAGLAIENARLYRQRSEIAQTLQSSLLPPALPEIERLQTAAIFRAAGEGHEVGGDFYDLFSTGQDQWFAIVGDVCGKGAEAAATTAMVRYTVRSAAVRDGSPAAILEWLNDSMLRQDSGAMRFCTLAVVRLDFTAGGVAVVGASAGHPLPRIVRGDGSVERLGTHGTLVGITPDLQLEERSALLTAGERLVIFTDGLIEARAPAVVWSADEVDRQMAAANDPSLAEHINRLARAAAGDSDAPLRDDLAILALAVR
jgi:serine phosphatase RsbU (regulator of sigma subunit)/PAS domain-containing protein